MKRLLFLLLIPVYYGVAFGLPTLNFSDIISAPKTGGIDGKGAIVTIWGNNLGSEQGVSTVTCCGIGAANVVSWGNATAPSDLYTYHKMQKVSFTIDPVATDGLGEITVTVGGVVSNALPFTVRSGNIYFVKTTGNDSTGDGSWGTPWATIIKAKDTIAAGDIAYICDGIKQDAEDAYNSCVNLDTHGTADNPKAFIAYPGATVTVGTTSVTSGFGTWVTGGAGGYSASFWVISQFYVTPETSAVGISTGTRVVGNNITVPTGTGGAAALEFGKSSTTVLGNELYNCGTANASKLYHSVYVNNHTYATISNIEIGWNIIRNSTGNRGIQVYSDGTGSAGISGVTIHDNVIHDIRGNGLNINRQCTGTFEIYNNLIYRCGLGPDFYDGLTSYSGLYVASSLNSANVYFYNNTMYDCGNSLYPQGSGFLEIQSDFVGNIYMKNNIIYSTGEEHEPYMVSSDDGIDSGDNYNLFYGTGTAPSWDTAAINLHPQLTDKDTDDYSLSSISPCVNAGADTTAVVATDILGAARPQGASVDIGAYELATGLLGASVTYWWIIGN